MKRFILAVFCCLSLAAAPLQKTEPPADDVIEVGEKVADAPTDIDPLIEKQLAGIADFEAAEFSKAGRYGQVLSLYTTVPVDGVAALPDKLDVAPTDGVTGDLFWQATDLQAFPANIRVDVYDGPSGLGYVIVLEAKFNGELWQRSINFGPERYRDTDWLRVVVTQ